MTIEEILKREEGFVPTAYQDHLGFWTIGYGRLIDKKRGGGISEEEGLYLLRNDIARKRKEIVSALPWFESLDEVRQTVIQCMAFQLGISGLLSFRKTLEAVRTGDYTLAAKGMRASKWARQTPGRANRMADAMEWGVL